MRCGSLKHERFEQTFRKARPSLFRALDAIAGTLSAGGERVVAAPCAGRRIAVGDCYGARKTPAKKGTNRC